MDADGSNERVLLPQGSHGWSSQGVVDWSPDGTKLVMAGETDHWNLYVTDTDGSNPLRISERDGLYLDPSWSPDGSKIVYTAIPADREITIFDLARVFTFLEVFTSDPDGSNEVRHTFDDLRDHDPYFSPNGEEISFESQNGGGVFHSIGILELSTTTRTVRGFWQKTLRSRVGRRTEICLSLWTGIFP